MIDDLMFSTAELLCIAPAQAAEFGGPGPSLPSREQHGAACAVVEVVGTLNKSKMVGIRDKVSLYAGRDDIAEIVLLVDSPGGTVAGTHDLHLTIAKAAARKPVIAVAEDTCCSGALYAVCGATELVCGESTVVGSIGVYAVHFDDSKLLEKLGVSVIIVRSGKHKGANAEGSGFSEEQIAEVQRRVDRQAELFIGAVARGRKLSADRVTELADGRVFIGAEAVKSGLADRVATFEDVLADSGRRGYRREINALTGRAAVAKFEALVAEYANDRNCSETEARAAVASDFTGLAHTVTPILNERNENMAHELEGLIQNEMAKGVSREDAVRAVTHRATAPTQKRRGTAPLGDGGAAPEADVAGSNWEGNANDYARDEIDALMAKGIPRDKAAARVFARNPGLREAMIEEANDRPRKR